MGRRGDAWDEKLDTVVLPEAWPAWQRRVFLCTLPISVLVYVLIVIVPFAIGSMATHFADWFAEMWKK